VDNERFELAFMAGSVVQVDGENASFFDAWS
jgi:hypothetical protein